MFKILLGVGVLIVASHLTTLVYSVNYKLLDLEVDSCVSKIWAGRPISRDELSKKLNFLSKTDTVETADFGKYYEEITRQVKDPKFLEFSKDCLLLQEESSDRTTRIAVHLLLEGVAKKYTTNLAKFEKLQSLNTDSQEKSKDQEDNLLKVFLNADKTIEVK